MNFTRSQSALHSLHIFFNVDVVVYCEGGRSLSYNEAIETKDSDGTLDAFYWSSVVESYGFSKSFHFKSVGSKTVVNAIAEDVNSLGLSNVTVCRDADYERLLGRQISGTRIAWTSGYSWENDAISLKTLEGLAVNLIGNGQEGALFTTELRSKIKKLESQLSRWIEIDISLCSRGQSGIFDREKPLSSVDMSAPPALKLNVLHQKLVSAGHCRKPRKVVGITPEHSLKYCYGKLISKAIYHAFISSLQKFSKMKIEYELFMRLAIGETMRGVKAGLFPELSRHIDSQRDAFA